MRDNWLHPTVIPVELFVDIAELGVKWWKQRVGVRVFRGASRSCSGGSSKLFGDGARGGEWMGGDPGALWVRGLHGGLFIGVFWFSSANALPEGDVKAACLI